MIRGVLHSLARLKTHNPTLSFTCKLSPSRIDHSRLVLWRSNSSVISSSQDKSIEDKLNSFLDLPPPYGRIAKDVLQRDLLDRMTVFEHLAEQFPNNLAVLYHLGDTQANLLDYESAITTWEKVMLDSNLSQHATPEFNRKYERVKQYFDESLKRITQEEAKAASASPEKVFHKWAPIKPIPKDINDYKASPQDLYSDKWTKAKKDPEAVKKLQRLWSIETGLVEHLYSLPTQVTESLVHIGFPSLQQESIPESEFTTFALLAAQLTVIESVMNQVDCKQDDITPEFLCDLQRRFTQFARVTAITPSNSQKKVSMLIRRGKFKLYPNSPTRSDGLLHQYCPPSKVVEQVEELLQLYKGYVNEGVNALLLSAWLHHRFVQIHPFMDGNGRVARTIASIPLLKANLPPLIIWSEKKPEYIAALEKADKQDDLRPLMRIVEQSVEDAITFTLQAS